MSMSFTVSGLEETIMGLSRMVSGAPFVKQKVEQLAANYLADQMRLQVHVITGNLRNSIQVFGNTVTVSAPYAAIENARVGPTKTGNQGPHDFASRALRDVQTAFPNMVMDAYSQWIATGGY